MRLKKCLIPSIVIVCVLFITLSFPSFAAEYGEAYPSYVEQSGGCFIECQTNLGKGTILLPVNFVNNSLGFKGNGKNLMNITSGTINGYLTLERGGNTSYTVRATNYSTFQYRNEQGMNQYNDLTVTEIYNTNCFFVDNTELNRQTDRVNLTLENILSIAILFVIFVFVLFSMIKAVISFAI